MVIFFIQKNKKSGEQESKNKESDDEQTENDNIVELGDKKEWEMTPGEESDDEDEGVKSSNKDADDVTATGTNEEEVFIISFPTCRKRAYSVCLYVSSPTKKSQNFPSSQGPTIKSLIPRPIKPRGVTTIPSSMTHNHLTRPVIVHTPPAQPPKLQNDQSSRIPRPTASSLYLRHANFPRLKYYLSAILITKLN